jgi:hypothetical protein
MIVFRGIRETQCSFLARRKHAPTRSRACKTVLGLTMKLCTLMVNEEREQERTALQLFGKGAN